MELQHTFTVAAPVEQAWEILLDLERIAPCMPGATLTSYEGDEFTGNVRVKLGPVTMTFAGRGRFTERDAESRRIVVEASGKDKRGGGTARATITAALRPDGEDATVVDVNSDLVVTGRVAQFGRGMIADVSTKLLGQFTDCLSRTLAPAAAASPAAAAPTAAPAPEAVPAAAEGAERAPSKTAAPETAPREAAPSSTAPPEAAPPAASRSPAPARQAEPIDLLGVT